MRNKTEVAASVGRMGGGAFRLGYVPLVDAAPLVMAKELGFFKRFGVEVELHRELGWATVRDKILFGELDASHGVVGMPFAMTLGLGSAAADCVAAMVTNLNGATITLSRELWSRGVVDAPTLREHSRRERLIPAIGVVFRYSSHHFLLREWLRRGGMDPGRDVRVVVVPPPQLAANLRAGHIDGFCVGEPWNSVARESGAGVGVTTSSLFFPGHPDKVLVARRDLAERDERFAPVVAAIAEACAACDDPARAGEIADVLSRQRYIGLPAEILVRGLLGTVRMRDERIPAPIPDFNVFHRDNACAPTLERGGWALDQTLACDPMDLPLPRRRLVERCFGMDLYDAAMALRQPPRAKPVDADNLALHA